MPGFDRSGPWGEGPMTGWQRGYCGGGRAASHRFAREYGRGRFRGRGRRIGRGSGYGFGPGYGPVSGYFPVSRRRNTLDSGYRGRFL